jgi:streptomycin 6-kinase
MCKTIDRITDPRIDKRFVAKASELKSALLDSVDHEYLCHGDLHLENIIKQNSNWVAIDPKGIIGEMAFEAAAFDLIRNDEMEDVSTIPDKILDRATKLSVTLDLNVDRLLSWIFLRIIISAQWFVEDNGDPSLMLALAKHVYILIDKRMGTN